MTLNMINADTEGHIASFVVGNKAMPAYRSLAEEMGFTDAVPEKLALMVAKNGALDEIERFIEETPGVDSDGNMLTRRWIDAIISKPEEPHKFLVRFSLGLGHFKRQYFCNTCIGRLREMTVGELKRHCKMNGIKRYSKLRRRELIKALLKL